MKSKRGMGRTRGAAGVALRAAAVLAVVALAASTPGCKTPQGPVAYDHFSITNDSMIPADLARMEVRDEAGEVFDTEILRQGQPIHPGETVTWIRPRYADEPMIAAVDATLSFDAPPNGRQETTATATADPGMMVEHAAFHFREKPDLPGEFELTLE